MDANQMMTIVKGGLSLLFLLLGLLVTLSGIAIYQNARANRLLKSIDRSLKLLPGVAREQKRAA